jgi:hypothetical protein
VKTLPIEINRDALDAAVDAAFPGLPADMTMDEARRRVAKALEAAFPRIERAVLDGACERIRDFGRDTGDPQTARAYERTARGER